MRVLLHPTLACYDMGVSDQFGGAGLQYADVWDSPQRQCDAPWGGKLCTFAIS